MFFIVNFEHISHLFLVFPLCLNVSWAGKARVDNFLAPQKVFEPVTLPRAFHKIVLK